MRELLSEWLVSITAVSLLSSFATAMSEGTSARRIVRLTGALALIAALILPLKNAGADVFSISLDAYSAQYERAVSSGENAAASLLAELTREELENLAVRAAGTECRAEVEVEVRDGFAVPVSCSLMIGAGDVARSGEIAGRVRDAIGIVPEVIVEG